MHSFWIAAAILVIFLTGEPTLREALVSYLTGIPISEFMQGPPK